MSDGRIVPFNPLDKKHLGESVAQALIQKPVVPLSAIEAFSGAGIYAIYYTGRFPAYKTIREANNSNAYSAPIYVGKAVPKGTRKGGKVDTQSGRALHSRLMQHARSLEFATNLKSEDFFCRFLLVDDIWISLGESLLIARYNPIWNCLVDGFGNHDPGKGRHAGMRSRWDVLHPGRPWAEHCKNRPESRDQIIREIQEYLRSNPPPNIDSMLSP